METFNETAVISSNVCVGPDIYEVVLKAPHIAGTILPGQFVHLLLPGFSAHVLRRPFSVYAIDESSSSLTLAYQIVGEGTSYMSKLSQGQTCELIGPLGRGWSPPSDLKRVLLVGGGIGAAPLYGLAESFAYENIDVRVILGARTKEALTCRNRFASLLVNACKGSDAALRCATDDGSYGREGFCTSLVEEALHSPDHLTPPYDYMAVCGPEPFMRVVSQLAHSLSIPCEVSLERYMACGIGACLSCVVETISGKKRVCVDGPVFLAEEVMW